jgi:hypothetical protein
MMGYVRRIRRQYKAWILATLALYGLAVAANPVLHSDLASHLKSPSHCSACTASPSAFRVESVGPLLPAPVEAGRVEAPPRISECMARALTLAGRSPPA